MTTPGMRVLIEALNHNVSEAAEVPLAALMRPVSTSVYVPPTGITFTYRAIATMCV